MQSNINENEINDDESNLRSEPFIVDTENNISENETNSPKIIQKTATYLKRLFLLKKLSNKLINTFEEAPNGFIFMTYLERYGFMTFWIILLSINFYIARLLAYFHIPYDANYPQDPYSIYESFSNLLIYGFILGWFVNINDKKRFIWLFSWKRWYFYIVLFGTSPIFSTISNFDGLKHGLEDVDNWSIVMYVIIGIVSALILVTLIWHIWCAYKNLKISGLIVYIMARLIVLIYFYIAALILSDTHYNDIHIHHYFIAWCCALFAEFNDPISALFLGICTSIYIQGVGAYEFAPIFNDPSCVGTLTETEVTCFFSSETNFTLYICPGAFGSIPDVMCYRGDLLTIHHRHHNHTNNSLIDDDGLWNYFDDNIMNDILSDNVFGGHQVKPFESFI